MTYKLRTYFFSVIFTFFCAIQVSIAQNENVVMDSINLYQKDINDYIKNQDYNNALKNLTKAYKKAITINNDTVIANIRYKLSNVFYHLQHYEKAALEVNEAITLIKKTKNLQILAKLYSHSGRVYTCLNKFEEAESFLKEAEKIYFDLKDEKRKIAVLFGRGKLEMQRTNYNQAVNYFNECISLFKVYNIPNLEAEAELKKAEALIKLSNVSQQSHIDIAETSINNAIALIDEYQLSYLKNSSIKILSDIAFFKEDHKSGASLLKEYYTGKEKNYQNYINTFSESIYEESKKGDLNEQIEAQNTKIRENEQSYKFIKMTTVLSIALIVILSLLTLSLYKNNNLRAQANNLLQDKNSELQLSKEKAEQASLAKAQFLSTITHELRTPLYAVTGLTHLLLEEDPKEHQKEHLNSLRFSGEYLLSLINNILDLNKLEANKVEVEKTSFFLKKRIDDVLVALKKSADDKKNMLRLEYDDNIPDKLEGDPLKLSQVLINLIGNALKFTQNGEVVVRVKKLSESGKHATLHFEVEDNGVGISQKKQKTIFESFSQASLQINRKFGGTGLGLSIVKNLLELMNSKIHLESQLGQGSKFWFKITIEVAELSIEEKNNVNALSEFEYQSLEHKHVLVVEDNKINQMITRKILEKNQIVCQVADNGMDAIDLVSRNKFDVVLMDIHMPGISGIEATQKIRKFDTEIPIIALTAVTIDENLDEFYKVGFNDIIPKPFKTEEFFQKIYKNMRQTTDLT